MQHAVQSLIINHYLFIVVGKCSKCKTYDQLFLTKVIKLMPPDALNSAQNVPKMRLAARLGPDPLGELTALPRPSSWIHRILLIRGREGQCAQFCIQIWGDRSPSSTFTSFKF